MAISANLGRDTDHNSTKLVCDHPLHTTPTVHSTTISRFPCNFFPEWPLIFLVISIHQVIWPSPGTLATSPAGKLLRTDLTEWGKKPTSSLTAALIFDRKIFSHSEEFKIKRILTRQVSISSFIWKLRVCIYVALKVQLFHNQPCTTHLFLLVLY